MFRREAPRLAYLMLDVKKNRLFGRCERLELVYLAGATRSRVNCVTVLANATILCRLEIEARIKINR